jgi:hypothetical protein
MFNRIAVGLLFLFTALVCRAQAVGVFPDFVDLWFTTPGPVLGSGADIQVGPNTAAHSTAAISGATVQENTGGGAARAMTVFGEHHTFASSVQTSAGNSGTAISLWKDVITVFSGGNVSLAMVVDGTITNASTGELFFEINRLSDSHRMASGHFSVAGSSPAVWEWFLYAENNGILSNGTITFPRSGGRDVFNLPVNNLFLAADNYEVRSEFVAQSAFQTAFPSTSADFFNTVQFGVMTVAPGMVVTSASTKLQSAGPGQYRYVTTTASADLSVSASATKPAKKSPAEFAVSVTAANAGPDAVDATLTVPSPAAATLLSATPGTGCSVAATQFLCSFPLAAGASRTFVLEYDAPAGTMTVAPSVTSNTPDPNAANNTTSLQIRVHGKPKK